MRRITTRVELLELAQELRVRAGWHEPDEQSLGATVEGTEFDNAGFWPVEAVHARSVFTYTDPSTSHTTRTTIDDPDACSVELNVVLWRTDIVHGREVHIEPIACVNLATLLAWATGFDDDSRMRVDWRAELIEIQDGIEKILSSAGIEYPTGLGGVRDLVAQRDGHMAHVRELEDRLREVRALADRLATNPDVSVDVVTQLREAASDVPADERLTEAEYRSNIASEIYAFGASLEHTTKHHGVGLAARAIVDEVGNRVGKMGGTP